jgi:DNA-binding NarL/FixJ family response regulator
MSLQVFIFEDNELIRHALEAIVNKSNGYHCCGMAPDGSNWYEKITAAMPDLILMDIEMPGADGIELTALIKVAFPEMKILVQTVFEDSERIFKALRAGATGYILKRETPDRLIAAMNEVMNGGAPMSSTIAKKVIDYFGESAGNQQQQKLKEAYNLTDREKEILSFMVKGHNLRSIAEKCFISYETVKTHVKNIYKKLHVNTSFEAIHKANEERLTD